MPDGPVLESARLRLRPHDIGDFEMLHALSVTPASRRFFPGEPSREDSYKRLLTSIASWHLFGYGTFAVHERASGAHVGNCGLFRLERDLDPPFAGEPEAGWIIAEDRWGGGYAGEAMRTVLAWFDAAVAIRRTVCMITPGNRASERVAAKLGYQPIGPARYRDDEEVMRYAREI